MYKRQDLYGAPDGGHVLSKEQNTVPSAGQESGFDKLIEIFNVPEVAGSLESSSQETKNNIEQTSVNNDSFFMIFIFLFPFFSVANYN